MKINPQNQQPPIQSNRSDDAKLAVGTGASGSGDDVLIYKGDVPELPQLTLRVLVGKLRSEPGIREDVVEASKAKVKSGEYLSTKSADDTARGILGL
ncbi:MAG: flagellar biosynthesis anti-sigma factor FlgM [Pirellulaceae bacterium]